MLKSINKLIDCPLDAIDGKIGKVKDFLFDDQSWTLRYLVANTGGWLSKNKILISSHHLKTQGVQNHKSEQSIPTELRKKQIENSPPLSHNMPISRRYEVEYLNYYNLHYYWVDFNAWGASTTDAFIPNPSQIEQEKSEEIENRINQIEDCHLRSSNETIGYQIEALDGHFGHIEDFIFDDNSWRLQYVVIDSRNWLPGKKHLLHIDRLTQFSWNEKSAAIDLNKEEIEAAPEYNANAPIISDTYIQKLSAYYTNLRP